MVGRHGIDLTGFGIHDDHCDIFRSVTVQLLVGTVTELFIQLFDVFFHDLLNVHIQRGYQAVTVLRFDDRTLQLGIFIEIAEFPAVDTIEYIRIIRLQAYDTIAEIVGKAYHRTGQRLHRILPDIILFKPDSLHILPLGNFFFGKIFPRSGDGGLIGIFFFLCDLFFQNLILAVSGRLRCDQASKLCFIQSEGSRQCFYRRLQISLFFIDCLTVQDHRINLFASGKYIPVPVPDLSPPVRNASAVILLLGEYLFGIFIAALDIDVGDPQI